MINRTVKIKRRVVSYNTEEINLYDFLTKNLCELYISHENKCIEIRIPTRVEYYSHFVAEIPLDVVDVKSIKHLLKHNQHNSIIEKHINDIVWKSSQYHDVVTKP